MPLVSTPSPPNVGQLLDEFGDVLVEELPPDLPLMCNIQHQIDLFPDAAILNRPHYWMTLINMKLDRGYMRESTSPCVVPALLVSKKDGSWLMCMNVCAVNEINMYFSFSMPRYVLGNFQD